MERTVTMSIDEYSDIENTIKNLKEENKRLIEGAFTVYSNGRSWKLENTPTAIKMVEDNLNRQIDEYSRLIELNKENLTSESERLRNELFNEKFENVKYKILYENKRGIFRRLFK